MNKTKTKSTKAKALPPAVKNTNLKLEPVAVAVLNRLKVVYGVSNSFAISRGVVLLEQQLSGLNGGAK